MAADFDPIDGETVLVRAVVSKDGRSLIVAPGVELPTRSVDMVCEAPARDTVPELAGVVLFFESNDARDKFIFDFNIPDAGHALL